MGSRRRGRETALQVLYQLDAIPDAGPDEALRLYFAHLVDGEGGAADADARAFTEQLVRGVHAHLPAIDECVRRSSQNWRLERMARVDRNILRIATYELLHEADVPKAVVIDEAIEVAKRFGSEESAAFVNGVLDRIATQARPGEE